MDSAKPVAEQLAALAEHLAGRRQAILETWRRAAEADPELPTVSALSRAQFYDHIPEVLDAFEGRLAARRREEKAEAAQEQREGAAGHGVHRWQQGYRQREVMREWRHLHLCLVDELETYARAPDRLPEAMSQARRALAELCSEGVCEAAAQYAALQQTEAAGRVRDLERALTQVIELQRQKAQMWHEAAHDLRGNLGMVRNAAAVLTHKNATETVRDRFMSLLDKGVESLNALLNDLIILGRLEAGQEQRQSAPFDAAAELHALAASLKPLAEERGLFLKTEGPEALAVTGDAVKVRRIAQNLLLNAIKYTERGGVTLGWQEDARHADHWALLVQDTGPGLPAALRTPLARALKAATEEAHAVESGEPSPNPSAAANIEAARQPGQTSRAGPTSGEGIGLSIVKRLCELLDASIELETEPGKGSTFRVIFPRRYDV